MFGKTRRTSEELVRRVAVRANKKGNADFA
jgi:hypothetical protein